MITFNNNDYFIPSIRAEAKFHNLVVQKNFRVFGLRQEDNPPLLIRYGRDSIQEPKMANLHHVFKKSDFDADFYRDYPKGVSIGLRRDVRENVQFASALLQTIIYYIEGKIDVPKTFRIPTIKKFKRNGVVVPPDGSKEVGPYDMDNLVDYYFGSRY